jgi:hypothetical protein
MKFNAHLRFNNLIEFLEAFELAWGKVNLSGKYLTKFHTEVLARDFSTFLPLLSEPCFGRVMVSPISKVSFFMGKFQKAKSNALTSNFSTSSLSL